MNIFVSNAVFLNVQLLYFVDIHINLFIIYYEGINIFYIK